jgi:hypothetical protein
MGKHNLGKKAIYWWHFRYYLSWVIGSFVMLGIGSWVARFVLDSAGAGALLKNIVYTILLVGSVLLPVQRVKATWPPTEGQAKTFKKRLKTLNKSYKSKGGAGAGGPGINTYECEECGAVLENTGDINNRSSFRCGNCNHKLDDQVEANDIYHWEM